jgi:hypothetical protein
MNKELFGLLAVPKEDTVQAPEDTIYVYFYSRTHIFDE